LKPQVSGTYPDELAKLEQQLVEGRQNNLPKPKPDDPPHVLAGLALSGGGIRSATFCLGVLQAFARRKLLQRFDFLSTVSGGGYIGSFLGAWINRAGMEVVQQQLPDTQSEPLRFLRDNGRYLAPNGGADILTAAATHLRSWFTIWLVLGSFVLGGLLTTEAVKILAFHEAWEMSLAREKGSPVFLAGDFSGDCTPRCLLRALHDKGIKIPKAPTEIERLNKLLLESSLYETIRPEDASRLIEEAKRLLKEAKSLSKEERRLLRQFLARAGLSQSVDERIRFNRFVLETVCSNECPKKNKSATAPTATLAGDSVKPPPSPAEQVADAVTKAGNAVGNAVTTSSAPKPSFWTRAQSHINESPFFRLAGWVLLVFALPLATAYWFINDWKKRLPRWLLLLFIGLGLGVWWYLDKSGAGSPQHPHIAALRWWLIVSTIGYGAVFFFALLAACLGWLATCPRKSDPDVVRNDWKKQWPRWLLLLIIGLALGVCWYLDKSGAGSPQHLHIAALRWWLIVSTIGYGVALFCSLLPICLGWFATYTRKSDRDVIRNQFTDGLATSLKIAGAIAIFAVLDTVGQSLATGVGWWMSAAVLPALAAAAQWVLPRLAEASKGKLPGWLSALMLPLAAAVVVSIALGILSMTAHRIGGAIADPVRLSAWAEFGVAAGVTLLFLFAGWWRNHWSWDWFGNGVVVACVLAAGVLLFGELLLAFGGAKINIVQQAFVVALAASVTLFVTWMLGMETAFVNASSLHRLYSSRLTRAYLGASNPQRSDPAHADVTTAISGDQIEYPDYQPHKRGGPLHLINATVNETLSGISNIEQRDRHGFSFALGPSGVSVRPTDHAIFDTQPSNPSEGHAFVRGGKAKDFHTLAITTDDHVQIELPPLGRWVGISGAAFTTGLGARTSLAFSFLLGFFNIRLGYWWDSGVNPWQRADVAKRAGIIVKFLDMISGWFPVQTELLDEFLAQFYGPARRYWYLSDGGHFENCAVYELIRRRLPLIVCCDCGADPKYEFEDLANLVRKARIDFKAEVEFWKKEEVEEVAKRWPKLAGVVGALDELKPVGDYAKKHVAIAWVKYDEDKSRSLLVVIKPTVSEDMPVDVLNYRKTETSFPQQTTLDQFFNEAQWESYRKLGEFIGDKLFGDGQAGSDAWNALASLANQHPYADKSLEAVP